MDIDNLINAEAELLKTRLTLLKQKDIIKYYELRSDIIRELGEDFYYKHIGLE